jgi:glycosyltransferase involved in cell wall biosynthesis
LELEAHFRPDVIHLNNYCHGALPWSAPAIVVGHSCVLSWWQAVKGVPAPAGWDRYRKEVRRGLQAANRVVTPTAAMLASLLRLYGPLPPSRVIPNGRSPAAFQPADKEEFVFSAGRLWDAGKNIALLEQVAPDLTWPVFLAGEEQPQHAGAAPANESLVPYTRRLGRLPATELAGWLARAAIYTLPARYEPFGLSVLEAGLSGCALVLGDIPSLRELWQDAAVFVAPDDPSALWRTLNLLIESAPRRAQLGARARARALAFSDNRMADCYLATYAAALRSPGAPDAALDMQPAAERPAASRAGG